MINTTLYENEARITWKMIKNIKHLIYRNIDDIEMQIQSEAR